MIPRTPDLQQNDAEKLRAEIGRYFNAVFDAYESLFETLASDRAYYVKPIPLRHPLIFYFGHTASFFVNKMVLAGLMKARIDPRIESMCAVGVDEMSWDDLDEAHYDWPQVDEVRGYRKKVRQAVNEFIAAAPLVTPVDWENPWWALMMGIEHELIHLETSSVLIRQHALEYVKSHPSWPPCRKSGRPPANEFVEIPAGTVRLGKERSDPYYGWDNEYGCREAEVESFLAAKYLVSNEEFNDFVTAGGYESDRFWDEEGRAWKSFSGARHPTFWVRADEGWRLRLMCEEVPLPWDWPVEVNCLEARAFCAWKTEELGRPVRLPSEDEWQRMADSAGVPPPGAANLHLDHYASPCPVNEFSHGGLCDLTGNVWQWTETPIYPFPGFAVHRLYDDFTAPTYDGRHNIFKGGSWISCGNESLPASRYAFRRHFFQHAGFRYLAAGKTAIPESRYETDRLLSEYAEFHYGDEYFGVKNFPRALAEIAVEKMRGKPKMKALDLGCAAGRATFELARHFERVTGLDFSARFIGLGVELAKSGVLRYTLTEEGELVGYRERTLQELGLEEFKDKVEFFQGDACNLKPLFTGYDLILAANLIDRLYSPAKFLRHVHERLNPGGLLLIASPYSWSEEHTPREEWLGGFKRDGENLATIDAMSAILGENFTRLGEFDLPFVIRETARKFQHTLSQVSLWERNG